MANNITEILKDDVIQRVIAERSEIEDIEQESTGAGSTIQEVIGKKDSKIKGVKQRKKQ